MEFQIRFVLLSSKWDEQGFLYYQDISLVDPRSFLEHLLETKFYDVNGGFCLVINNHIWNSNNDSKYDPRKLYCIADNVSMAKLFLETFVIQIEDEKTEIRCQFLDTIILNITLVEPGTLKVVGESVTGSIVLHEFFISFLIFCRELYRASSYFISFAKDITSLLHTVEHDNIEEGRNSLQKKLNLDHWEKILERLLRIIQQEETKAGIDR